MPGREYLSGKCRACPGGLCRNCPKDKPAGAGKATGCGTKPLAQEADVIYLYDNSLAGFFCCVYESVYNQELPVDIVPQHLAQPSLLPSRYITTDAKRAKRVRNSIPAKICAEALHLIEQVFFSCMEQKELASLRFLLFAYQQGGKAITMLGHPLLAPLLKAQKHLVGEAHLLTGFVRFSDYDGVLAATITPKNFVLPYLAHHFVSRYPREQLLIFDKTHQAALVYQQGKQEIIAVENITFPQASAEEQGYRSLWKQFYKTIAIEARENPRCRMTHMPKRYWENMTEMQEFL